MSGSFGKMRRLQVRMPEKSGNGCASAGFPEMWRIFDAAHAPRDAAGDYSALVWE
jgi:hypothetical protein